MKKFLSLSISLLLIVLCFSGCNGGRTGAEKVVRGFESTYYIAYDSPDDLKGALAYCNKNGNIYRTIQARVDHKISDTITNIAENNNADRKVVEKSYFAFRSYINESTEITITGVSVSKDKKSAVVKTTRTCIDEDKANAAYNAAHEKYFAETGSVEEAYLKVTENIDTILKDVGTKEVNERYILDKVDGEWKITRIW